MDVGAWLRGLGLGQYEQAFRDNEIDAEVLPGLTAEDLKDVGVTLVGHRRRLLTAIADLDARPRNRAAAATSAPASAIPEQAAGERRHLTVVFCDLVGSTRLARRLDPEEMREVLLTYHNAVSGEIAHLEGYIAKFMGGTGTASECAVVGETPNLAARLQSAAAPNEVLVAASTRQLVSDLFRVEETGPLDLRGIDPPVRAFRVIGESSVESRLEARSGGELRPMVGRDHELALVLDRWRFA